MKIGKLKWTVLSMLFPLLLIACGGNTSNNDTNGSANQSSLEASDSQQSSVGNASSSVHEHTFDSSWSSDAEYHWHASTCGCDGVDGKEKHTFEIEVTEPTFESDGCSTYICTICGYSYTDGIVDKLTHNFSHEWSYDDVSHWHSCLDKGYEDLRSDEAQHNFKDEILTPTYEYAGYTTHTCMECGYSYTDNETDKLEHQYSEEWNYNGNSHWHTCTDDGYENLRSEEAQHSFTDKVTAPTYESSGYTTHTCTVCGYSYKDSSIDKLSHQYSAEWSYDASTHWHSCTDSGYEGLKSDETKHNFTSEVTAPTYVSGGYTTHTCIVCGYSYIDGETKPLIRKYTITWKNWDGTVLEMDTDVEEGTVPSYDGLTPIRPEDETYTYTWEGWSPEVTKTSCNQIYTATFHSEKIKYTVDFDLDDGTSSSYTGTKVVEAFTNDIFFFDVKKEGYNFRGWSYNGEKVFDEKGKLYFTPKMEKKMTFVALFSQTVKMSVTTNMTEAGVVIGQGEYAFNSYVDISARPYQGYRFVGWYYQGILLSETQDYKYMMWDEDITIEARFELDTFKLTVSANNDYGLVLIKADGVNEYKPYYKTEYKYTEKVTIAAYSKSDVRFLGWYDFSDNKLVSTSAVYSFTMPGNFYYLEAKWNYFSISYNLNGGTNSSLNQDYYTLDNVPTLYSPSKPGYTFLGWKYNGEFVTSINLNWLTHITLDAVWETDVYEITYHLDGGTNSSANPSSYNIESSDITLISPTKRGYEFLGWYLDSEYQTEISTIANGSYGNVNLYAKWKAITYSITYNLDGGVDSSENPSEYNVEDEIVLSSPVKDGYSFLGWYEGSTKISSLNGEIVGNLSLEARWSANLNKLIVTSDDESKGTAEIVSGSGYTGETITLRAEANMNYCFLGWYVEDTKVSSDFIYTFKMPSHDYDLKAQFVRADGTEIFKDNEFVFYGIYPQTHVSDETLITTLNALTTVESNGWYLYDGDYYAKLTAKPYEDDYTFDDGTKIKSGTEYWFKCEPITWKVLESNDGEYKLVSSVLLDEHCYYSSDDNRTIDGSTIYPNNYKYSDIRAWLNDEFYNSAFSLGNSYIQTTEVDNSASTTDSSTNKYVCENTYDKVYLLSYHDYKYSSYFANDAARQCKTTDYARANGCYSNTNSSYKNNGRFWSRSPYDLNSYSLIASIVSYDGNVYNDNVDYTYNGVRPALTVKFE